MVAAPRSRLWRIPRAAVLEALVAEPKAAVALVAESQPPPARRQRRPRGDGPARPGRPHRAARAAEANARAVVPLTQTEIARHLGASREKVNRKLHDWAARGLVEITPAGVRLVETDSLAALVERSRRR
jgi:CRP/FNR family transcriptional regulator, cyclic AMP receptor protein